jgi:hypothetical protein
MTGSSSACVTDPPSRMPTIRICRGPGGYACPLLLFDDVTMAVASDT